MTTRKAKAKLPVRALCIPTHDDETVMNGAPGVPIEVSFQYIFDRVEPISQGEFFRMKVGAGILTAVALCASRLCAFGQFKDVCDAHGLAAIKNASEGKSSLLCEGVADLSLGRSEQGRKILLQVIHQAPQSDAAYEAHERLSGLYARFGQMREASKEMAALVAMKPYEPDVRNVSSLFEAMGRFPDMKVSHLRPTSFSSKLTDGTLSIPFSVNGNAATFFLDTGGNFSIISDREARALGLTVTSVSSSVQAGGGLKFSVQITEIGELRIGSIRLEHVPFMVVSASNPPFNDIPLDNQGLFGIQVALALRAIRLGGDGHVDLGFKANTFPNALPLTFDDMTPILHVIYRGKQVPFTFDTGAEQTMLNPPFLRDFPEVAKLGVEKSHKIEGYGGSIEERSILLPVWRVDLGGRTATVHDMPILLQKTIDSSEWAAGNFGLNILEQVEPFTIDFEKMQLDVGAAGGR